MTVPATLKKPQPRPVATDKSNTLHFPRRPGETNDQAAARLLVGGTVANAVTAINASSQLMPGQSLTDLTNELERVGRDANAGDLAAMERMLVSQSVALNAVFCDLTHRAQMNFGHSPEAVDRYMRLALRAQSQARATIETLAAVKNPPVVYARQANINNGGQQQVNNSSPAPARELPAHAVESSSVQNKLLEESNGEWLDRGAQGAAGGADTQVATLGKVHGSEDAGRQGACSS